MSLYLLLKMWSEILLILTPFIYNIQCILFGFLLLLNIFFIPIKYQTLTTNDFNKLSTNCKLIKTYNDTSSSFGLFLVYKPYLALGIVTNKNDRRSDTKIDIICFNQFLIELENNFDKTIQKKSNIYAFVPKYNAYWCCMWDKISVNLQKFKLKTDNQIECLEYLKKNNDKNSIILICGPPKTGKSSIGLIHAQELQEDGFSVYITNDYSPTNLGVLSGFQTLYSTFEDKCNDEKKRLIIMIDEVDTHLDNIEFNHFKEHNEHKREVSNKSEWNKWIDDLHSYRYKNITFILTTNKSQEYFNGKPIIGEGIDSSYLRDGRVNKKFKFFNKIE